MSLKLRALLSFVSRIGRFESPILPSIRQFHIPSFKRMFRIIAFSFVTFITNYLPTIHPSSSFTFTDPISSGYPILNRAAFGVFGAWWPTFNRAVMAIVWNGVNAVQGGECVYVMLHTLSPHVANFKNVMGEGSALDSGGMLGLGIFWILTCCFLIIPVPKVSPYCLLITSHNNNRKIDERTRIRQTYRLHHFSNSYVCLDLNYGWRYWSSCQSTWDRHGHREEMASRPIYTSWCC